MTNGNDWKMEEDEEDDWIEQGEDEEARPKDYGILLFSVGYVGALVWSGLTYGTEYPLAGMIALGIVLLAYDHYKYG